MGGAAVSANEAMIEALHPVGAPSDEDLADDQSPQQTWMPADAMQADWVGRKVLRAQAAIAQIEEDYQAQRALLDAYREAAKQRHLRTEQWGKEVLEVYVRTEIRADDAPEGRKVKSRRLPCGVQIGVTDGQPKVEIEDEDRLVGWLQKHRPDLVQEQTKLVYSKREVGKLRDDKDRLAVTDPETGELVEAEGARVTRAPSFYLKANDTDSK